MDAFAAKRLEAVFFNKKVPPTDLVEVVDSVVIVRREEGLGLEVKNLMVIGMAYNSPCIGIVKMADILLHMNGVPIMSQATMSKHIASLLTVQPAARVVIKSLRLKRHIARPLSFPALVRHEGFVTDTIVLYNLKGYFHLGLDIKELEGKLVVCDIVENSLSDITFSLGEAIIDVDGEKTLNCFAFNDRVKKSLEIRNFCLVTVEVPQTDPLKNLLRNKITTALKEGSHINRIPADARVYAAEGVAVLRKHGNDPFRSIWAGDRSKISLTRQSSDTSTHLRIDDRVKETDVPSTWNSRLFVRLPPMKTLETETMPQ